MPKSTYIPSLCYTIFFILYFVIFFLFTFQYHFIYKYKTSTFELPPNATTATIETIDNKELIIYTINNKKPTDLIFFHGYRMNKTIHLSICNEIKDANVITIFYRGFGHDKTTELGILYDIHSLALYYNKIRKNNKLVVYGQSLGSVITSYFLSLINNTNTTVILENPFENIFIPIKRNTIYTFLRFIIVDTWNMREIVHNTLILTAEKDQLVPKQQRNIVKKYIKNQVQIIELKGVDHFNMRKSEIYYKTIKDYILS